MMHHNIYAVNNLVSEPSKNDEGDIFMVQDILKKRRSNGKIHYLVKWHGYDAPSWQPAKDVRHLLRQPQWTFKQEQ